MHSIKKTFGAVLSVTFSMGVILYWHTHHTIVIVPIARRTLTSVTVMPGTLREVDIWYCDNQTMRKEKASILVPENSLEHVQAIVMAWLKTEKQVLPDAFSFVTATDTNELILCFNKIPFKSEQLSTYMKLMIIHGLLRTVENNFPQFNAVYLRLQNKALPDAQLSFEKAWPLAVICQKETKH